MQHAMNPVTGPRDAAVRTGAKPFNHARSNVSAIREASQLNALRKMAAAAEPSGRPGRERGKGRLRQAESCEGQIVDH